MPQMARNIPLVALLLGYPSIASAALYNQVIQTKYGPVQGYPAFNSTPAGNISNWQGVTQWLGIPFAADTGGENRWKSPQPRAPWNITLYANSYGADCPGSTSDPDYTIDEDCLNLNIWSNANSTRDKLPVVMWSYPAGGSNRDALFTGGGMAANDVVFVNINYRAGSFGWLAHPQLSQEFYQVTGSNSSGNWGMLDQFAALRWVHENIEAFGGDPEKITVQGQSAGSAATYHILNSPLTRGLFRSAIIESGVRDPYDPLCSSLAENYKTLEWQLSQGVNYTNYFNVSTIEELRQLSMDELLDTGVGVGGGPGGGPGGGASGGESWEWSATLDYYAMPDTYYNTLVKGLAADVPVITGNARDENGATYGLNITLAAYILDLQETFGNWSTAFFKQYPANDSTTASAAYNAQWTDRSKVGTWLWAGLWSTARTSPVYTYLWDHAPPGQDRGAYHESEINYVLNNLYDTDLPWTSDDYTIAWKMNNYWANFIKHGNPNGPGLAHWPATNSSKVVQEVGDGFGSIPIANDSQTALFEQWFPTNPLF